MDTPVVLARFWGILLVVLCGSLVIHAKYYVRLVRGFQNEATRFLYFYVVLVIGAVNAAVLNQWQWDYKGLITVLGWGAVLKGSFGILMPDFSNKIIEKVRLSPMVIYPSGVLFVVCWFWVLINPSEKW